MRLSTIAVLAVVPLVRAQNAPDPGKPQVTITIDQGVPLPGTTAQIVSGAALGAETVTGSPYSAQALTETTQTLADGSHIVQRSSSMIYRDSDGRERREYPQTVMISDPVAGVRYMLNIQSHTARKDVIARRLLPRIIGSDRTVTIEGGITVTGGVLSPRIGQNVETGTPGPPPKIEQLGTMTIEGVQAEGTRTTTTIPAGQIGNDRALEIVSERWVSPDLKVTVLTKHSDPRSGETVYRLTQINRSEPVHSLFEIPADYKVLDASGPIRAPNGAVRLP